MTNNIVDQIGSTVTVWCNDGNGMENRKLLTIDTFGIVVTGFGGWDKAVFIPWCQVKYVDYPNRSNHLLAEEKAWVPPTGSGGIIKVRETDNTKGCD